MAAWRDIEIGPRPSYDGVQPIYGAIIDNIGKIPCPCFRERAATVVVLGQSNAGNARRHSAREEVANFCSIYDGRCYRAADPLIGASGDGWALRAATRAFLFGNLSMILRGLAQRVILAPIAMETRASKTGRRAASSTTDIEILIRF